MTEPLRSPAEIERLERECELIPYTVVRRRFPWQWTRGNGWYWNFKDGYANGDLNDLEQKSPNYNKGVSLHEMMHVRRSRPEYLEDIWGELGCALGYNWVEDNRIEVDPDDHLHKGAEMIKEHLDVDISTDGGLDYKGILQKTKGKLGQIPKHMVLGAVMRQYFYGRHYATHGDQNAPIPPLDTDATIQQFIDEIPDEEVRNTFAKIREDVEQYFTTIESPHATQDEIEAKAKESAAIFRDKIWPEYKKLVEHSVDDQALADFFQSIIDQNFGEGAGEGIIIMVPLDALPQDVKDEIKEKMKQKAQQSGQTPPQQQQEGQAQRAGQDGSDSQQAAGGSAGAGEQQSQGEGDEEGQQAGESQAGSGTESDQGQLGDDQEAGDESGAGAGQTEMSQGQPQDGKAGEGSEDAKQQVKWDDLSDKAKEAIKEKFDEQDQEVQSDLKDKAKEKIAETEDEVNEELRGHSDDENSSKGTKLAEKYKAEKDGKGRSKSKPKISPEEAERRKRELDDYFREIREQFRLKGYERILALPEVHDAIEDLTDKFYPLFHPDEAPKRRYSTSGDELDEDRAFETQFDRTIDDPFLEESTPMQKSYRFTLLVDLSGSMEDKIEEVFKMVAILSETFTHLGIEFEVQGYSDNFPGIISVYKGYDDTTPDQYDLTKAQRDKLHTMIDGPQGGTPTSLALATSLTKLELLEKSDEERKRNHNFIMLFSDGQPNEGADAARENIEYYRTESATRDLNTRFIGFGVGPGTEFMDDMFPQLPKELRAEIAVELTAQSRRQSLTRATRVHQVTQNEVGNSYETISTLVSVMPIILDYILTNPTEF